jgi:hypothetical protein
MSTAVADKPDFATEELLPISEAARIFPRPGGGHANPATIQRWITEGAEPDGLRLEGCRIGRRFYTSRQAISRFVARLMAASAH